MTFQMKNLIISILAQNDKNLGDLQKRQYFRVENGSYMPLSVDYLGKLKYGHHAYSIAHNFIQNGDVMADPDMEFVDIEGTWIPATFQQDSLGFFQQALVYDNGKLHSSDKIIHKLSKFAIEWSNILINQGYIEGNFIMNS